jgi:N-acetylglucosaminyldiphosphoundecaprenol N-acetyl-beta-D-mannosaminyltransferase
MHRGTTLSGKDPRLARARQPPAPRRPSITEHDHRPIDAGKHNVLGVLVDALDYDAAVGKVMQAARERRALALTALAVHGVMTGVHDPAHKARLNALDVVTPDGQPVRWALNILHRAKLRDWVSGPELVLRVLRRMSDEGLAVYLYGSTPETLDRLSESLTGSFPALHIAGMEASKFRLAEPGEGFAIAERVVSSGARLVLVGLGCPRQEAFVHAMRGLADVPLMAVGAAFDYHAGRLRPAPNWMQRSGLAWLWRLGREPRRLWRRYLVFNVEYLLLLAAQTVRLWRPDPPAPAVQRSERFPV